MTQRAQISQPDMLTHAIAEHSYDTKKSPRVITKVSLHHKSGPRHSRGKPFTLAWHLAILSLSQALTSVGLVDFPAGELLTLSSDM